MDRIEHFSHDHWLTMSEIEDNEEINCFICDQPCPKKCYGCRKCQFFLHKACAELPVELNHPLHPPHTLSLRNMSEYVGRIYCDACGERVSGRFTFRCKMCDFDLDIECAKKLKDEKARIHHFSHDLHDLILEVIDELKQVYCTACEKRCFGDAYACRLCDFFLHKACAKLPREREHPLHPHVLKLCTTDSVYNGESVWCDLCDKNFHGFVFHCKDCHFDLDLICARIRFPVESGDQKGISLPGHKHPLTLIEKDENVTCRACGECCSGEIFGCEWCEYFLHKLCARKPYIKKERFEEKRLKHFSDEHELIGSFMTEEDKKACEACGKQCSGPTFSCSKCDNFLHEACTELPQELDHFFHPSHKLILQNGKSGASCEACEKKCYGFTFSCSECGFHMDTVCAMKVDKLKSRKYFGHFSHGHPLELTNNEFKRKCLACNKQRSGTDLVYGCNKCNVWLHQECAHLERKIEHFFHKNCAGELTLTPQRAASERCKKMKCKACLKECQGFTFHCEKCPFTLDLDCALLPSTIDHDALRFPGHGHPLQKRPTEEGRVPPSCSVCEHPCGGPTYQCIRCDDFMVHEHCTRLDTIISRPLLHMHEMHLSSEPKVLFTCKACLKQSSVFSYDCRTCVRFSLHIGCANISPIIKYDAHGHHLCFFESTHGKLQCNSCQKKIVPYSNKQKDEETKGDELFRCVKCDHSLHLLCGPLPRNIKSQNHKHVLQLKDKFVEDDSGEYYCDTCEGERDKERCVYKCAEDECPYVAHFECMKPEVIRLLIEDQKEGVELISLDGRYPGRVLSEGEVKDAAPDGGTDDRGIGTQETMILDRLLDALMQDEEMKFPGAFQSLTNEMYGKENSEISMIFFHDESLVKVKSYMVLESLSPFLEQLLEKHDISRKSQLNLDTKSLIFNVLCGVIRSTSSVHLDESLGTLLHNWWNHVKMAEHAGFEVQSVLAYLDKIRQVHLALQEKEEQGKGLKELDDQIKEWHESLKKLAAKAEDLTYKGRRYISTAKSSSVN